MSLLTRFFAAVTPSKGGGQLAPPTEAKVKPKQLSVPGHMTASTAGSSAIPKNDLNLANVDVVSTYRFGASTSDTIRSLIRANPDFGTALSTHLRLGIPERYIAPAYNPDGTFNVEATRLAMEVLSRIDTMPGYDTGFSATGSVRSTAEGLAKDGLIEGAMAMELVLNQARQPVSFAPIPFSKIKFYDDWSKGTKTLKPVQEVGGTEVDLDWPNVFMVWLDPSLLDAYPHAPFEAAIQAVLAAEQFVIDLRKLCQRHVYPRYDVQIDEEKLRKAMPEETLLDSKKRDAYFNSVLTSIQTMINDLSTEEAAVHFDFITIKFIEGSDGDVPDTFDTVKNIFNEKIATAARSFPAMLGHGSGSQNVASTETLLAMMTANSMVRLKLQEMFSKALTLACRLFGLDVTVRFEYDEIELRPATEVEAFKAMKQDRILRMISLGYMTDEEGCLRLTGRLPQTGFTPHWNTMFMDPTSGVQPGDNNYSGTGAGGGQSGGSAATQQRKPGSATQKRG